MREIKIKRGRREGQWAQEILQGVTFERENGRLELSQWTLFSSTLAHKDVIHQIVSVANNLSWPQWPHLSITSLQCNNHLLFGHLSVNWMWQQMIFRFEHNDVIAVSHFSMLHSLCPSSPSSPVLQHPLLPFQCRTLPSLVCFAAYLQSVNTSSSSPAIDLVSPLQSSQCTHANLAFDAL